jgi:hypothetical protein
MQMTLFMNRIMLPALLWMLAVPVVPAATLPIYVNSTKVTSPPQLAPQIDARAWLNQAFFGITNLTGIPYESVNTLFFTNSPLTIMNADPGYRFFQNVGTQRRWMDTWENHGTISTDHAGFISTFGLFFNDSRASILQVAATNITSTGPLFSGAHGLVRMEGRRINLTRNALRTGMPPVFTGIFGGGFLGLSNYVNDLGVTDLYWGTGRGNAVDNSRVSAMRVDGTGFTLPNPFSPLHDIIQPLTFSGSFFTNRTSLPGGFFFFGTNFFFGGSFFGGYTAAVNDSFVDASNRIVQVVFYPTNNTDSNFRTDVRFYDPFGGFGLTNPATVAVGFHSGDFDIATQTETLDSVYLVDELATTTNIFLARNLGANTRRPSTFEVTRQEPIPYAFGVPGNSTLRSNTFYTANHRFTTATNRYAAYGAFINLLSSSPSGSIPYDPTNMPGRIEVLGDDVDLDQTRIRAESAVIIKASNLTSNRLATVDAPMVNFDVRSRQPELVISNLAPVIVRRMSGSVRAWSGVWQNFEAVVTGTNITTNAITYHVLIVDNLLQSQVPVTVNEFAARGTNIVVQDMLRIGKSFVIEGNSWHLTGGLNLPLGITLTATNLLGLRNFTNDGILTMQSSQNFGADRATPYANYVNRGTNIGGTHFIRTTNFDNSGLLVANDGPLSVDTLTASLQGNPLSLITNTFTNFFGTNIFFSTNISTTVQAPKLQGATEVRLLARDLIASNSIIEAGSLIVGVTNSLRDSGLGAINEWGSSGGFSFIRRPATSDLFGTYLRSTAPRLAQVEHRWAATNLGASPLGFTNNLALGKLILDGGTNSLFRFFGVGTNNALYVDFIEVRNFATNYNSVFAVSDNLTIYFANANIPVERLDGAGNGRIRWVQDFAGPLSSTNLTYSNGSNYVFNIALVTSRDIDSDGDFIVNADDPEPIYVPSSASLSVSLAGDPLQAVLQWTALGLATNSLEYREGLAPSGWKVLTNFVHGSFTTPVTVLDPLKTNGQARVYRVRVDPPRY